MIHYVNQNRMKVLFNIGNSSVGSKLGANYPHLLGT